MCDAIKREIVVTGRILLCIILVAAFLLSFGTPQGLCIAGVDDLVVGGTAIMTIGLLGCLGVISLQASGAGGALAQMADNFSYNMETLGSSLMTSYARSQNMPTVDLLEIAQAGTKYTKDGKIIFDQRMSELMDSFSNWAWSSDGGNLIQYSTPVSIDSPRLDYSDVTLSALNYPSFDYVIYPYSIGGSFAFTLNSDATVRDTFTFNGSSPIYLVSYNNNSTGFYAISESSFSVSRDRYPATWNSSSVTRGGLTYYYARPSSNYTLSYLSPVLDVSSIYKASGGSLPTDRTMWDVSYLVFNGEISGDPSYDVNLDIFKGVGVDTVGVLDPDDLVTIPDAPASGVINIDDWLQALAEGIKDLITSIPVSIAQDQVVDVALELDTTADIPLEIAQEGEVVDPESVADSTSASGIDPYLIDLRDFFPFCIPFDLYRMLQLFAGSRQAPQFNYRFYVPNVVDQQISIDLSPFDSAAAVLRTCEKIAFAIGLAFVTKKLIQGGD